MAKFGKLEMPPETAIEHAVSIRRRADNIGRILEDVSREMNRIDNEGEGVYSGNRNAHELKVQLDEIKAKFEPLHAQILEYANAIEATARAAQNL